MTRISQPAVRRSAAIMLRPTLGTRLLPTLLSGGIAILLLVLVASLSHGVASVLPVPPSLSLPVATWSVESVVAFLDSLGLSEYGGAIAREQIDGEAMVDMTQQEWTEYVGVTKLGHRKKIEKAISQLRAAAGSTTTVGAKSTPTVTAAAPATANSKAGTARPATPAPKVSTPSPVVKPQQQLTPEKRKQQPTATAKKQPPSPQKQQPHPQHRSALTLAAADALLRLDEVALPPSVVLSPADDARIVSLLHRAVEAHQRDDLAQASSRYRQVLQLNPRQPKALHMLALIEMQQLANGQPAENGGAPSTSSAAAAAAGAAAFRASSTLFRQSLALSMEADAVANFGNLYFSLGHSHQDGPAHAVSLWHRALLLNPLSGGPPLRVRFAEVLYALALQTYSAGQVDLCREYLEMVVVLGVEAAYLHFDPEYTPRMSRRMNDRWFDRRTRVWKPAVTTTTGSSEDDGGDDESEEVRLASFLSSSPIALLRRNAEVTHAIRVLVADAWLHLGIIAEQQHQAQQQQQPKGQQLLALALAYYKRVLVVQPDFTDERFPAELRLATIVGEARANVRRFEMNLGAAAGAGSGAGGGGTTKIYDSPEFKSAWERVMGGQVIGAAAPAATGHKSSSGGSGITPAADDGGGGGSFPKRTRKLIEFLHKSCRTSHAYELARMVGDDAVFASPSYAHLFSDDEEITQTRLAFTRRLDQLLASPDMANRWANGVGLEWCRFRFYIAYHGRNNVALTRQLARVYEKAFPALRYTAPHLVRDPTNGLAERIRAKEETIEAAATSSGGGLSGLLSSLTSVGSQALGKLRVGFISAFLNSHPVGRTVRGWIQHLPRARFDVYAYFITLQGNLTGGTDAVYNEIERSVSSRDGGGGGMRTLPPENWPVAREGIERDRLDVLIYADIGMEATTYFLAFGRLAPVQAMTFGHPDTSGLETIDYFLSHREMDQEDDQRAQAYYSEKLVRLPGIGYWYRATRDDLPQRTQQQAQQQMNLELGRDYFGLSDRDLEQAGVRFDDPHPSSSSLPISSGVSPSRASSKYTLYLVTKSTQFFSPAFQSALASILHRHPRAFLVLLMETGKNTKGFDAANQCVETVYEGIERRMRQLRRRDRGGEKQQQEEEPEKEEDEAEAAEWERKARADRHPVSSAPLSSSSSSSSSPPWSQDVLGRLLSSTSPPRRRPSVSGRIRFVDRGDHAYFLSLLRVADVLLQPMPLDGTTTTLEAISVGTPTVVHRSETSGGRMAWAIYRHMGFTETCATTTDEYVDIAVRLGTDPAFAQRVREKLLEVAGQVGPGRVFEDSNAIDAYAEWLEQATTQVVTGRESDKQQGKDEL